ncbi:hypothetical protein AXE80_11265 [Wenyingzhuangia fucanilytica]|uniref:Rhamnan synthesis protein F n=1 Tax=Wenyingzhuangia fucanilytica TaxID=1790137 RepID=A0A1B1Y7S0_9FLAO|nr:rhamnan synthesis F family protein [Wenyingzhuangia fucanilytica]ANW96823.1 hypothetical protein AXE80_11265 [Wenyingzhuangia fucanilytica]
MNKNRLTFFSFFDPENQIDDYVIHYLTELNKVSDIIFSTDCKLPPHELNKVENLVLFSINKKHGQYDFGSHKKAFIEASHRDLLKNYDWLILANDSCYGPFYELEPIFLEMESKKLDYWGFSHNTIDLSPHIQSYFVALNKDTFTSKVFKDFILSIKKQSVRRNIIIKYEHGLTTNLKNAGFNYNTYFVETPGSFLHDPTKDWDKMIHKGFPFIKRTLFTRNNYNLDNLDTYKEVILKNHPEFDIKIIEENLNRYLAPVSPSIINLIVSKFKKIAKF